MWLITNISAVRFSARAESDFLVIFDVANLVYLVLISCPNILFLAKKLFFPGNYTLMSDPPDPAPHYFGATHDTDTDNYVRPPSCYPFRQRREPATPSPRDAHHDGRSRTATSRRSDRVIRTAKAGITVAGGGGGVLTRPTVAGRPQHHCHERDDRSTSGSGRCSRSGMAAAQAVGAAAAVRDKQGTAG